MAKFKPLNEKQLVMLPISLKDQLFPETLEHTINELVEKHLDRKVDVQWRLFAPVHNIGKIHTFGVLT